MLDPILVARDEAASDLPVVRVLALLVQKARTRVQELDHPRADGRLPAEPDRRAKDEDVRRLDTLVQLRPFVARCSVLAHVRPDSGREVVVDGAYRVDRDSVPLHDLHGDPHEPAGVRELG
jgi:hypothetical protein